MNSWSLKARLYFVFGMVMGLMGFAIYLAHNQSNPAHPAWINESFIWTYTGFAVVISTFGLVFVSQSLNHKLNKVIASVEHEVTALKKSVSKVSNVSQDLSSASTQQAAFIAETASSMEELTSMVQQTASNAEQSFQVSNEGQRKAIEGREVVDKLKHAMDEIYQSNEKLEGMVKLIEEIKSKTKIINEIVSETRLLSFNASIEAARAGVHGKGFAVVAEEVGKLAAVSGKAADEIRRLLDTSANDVSHVVNDTKSRVNVARKASEQAMNAFEDMGNSITNLMESSRLISNATKEQASGISQTNKAITEMDATTQTNSSKADQLAHESDQLSNTVVRELNASLESLQWIVAGDKRIHIQEPKMAPAVPSEHFSQIESMIEKQAERAPEKRAVKASKVPKKAPVIETKVADQSFKSVLSNNSDGSVAVVNILTDQFEPMPNQESNNDTSSGTRWRAS